MRLLFDLLDCSTQLRMDEITRHAIAELERLPEPKMSQLIADLIKAISLTEHGEAAKGLDLIEANLKSELMEREDFRDWRYKHLACKGSALIGLPAVSCWLPPTTNAADAQASAAPPQVVADNFPLSSHNNHRAVLEVAFKEAGGLQTVRTALKPVKVFDRPSPPCGTNSRKLPEKLPQLLC